MSDRNARTARIGVYAIGQIVAEEFGWIFREQSIDDFGIDAHIEICSGGNPTGKLIAVQIKSGESWFSSMSSEGYIYSGSQRHLEYWISHSLPVILVIYNPVSKKAWWVPIESKRIQTGKNKWRIVVPFNFFFNKSAVEELKPLAIPEYLKRKVLGDINKKFSKDGLFIGVGGLLDTLTMADNSLDLVSPYIDNALFWALKTLSHRVKVRLIISLYTTEEVTREIIKFIGESPGLDVRIIVSTDGNRSFLHSKFFIVDNEFVVYGSANFTQNSWREEREIVLASEKREVVEHYSNQFLNLWEDSQKGMTSLSIHDLEDLYKQL